MEGQGRKGCLSEGTPRGSFLSKPQLCWAVTLALGQTPSSEDLLPVWQGGLCRDTDFWKPLSVGVQKGRWGSVRASMDSITPDLKNNDTKSQAPPWTDQFRNIGDRIWEFVFF